MKTFVFPGQGSQSVGMGREFYDAFTTAREVFEEANDALNFDLRKVIFEGPMETLTMTENTQPALVTVSIAVLKTILKESGRTLEQLTDFVAGHSLGEYAALCAVGVLTFADAVRLVRLRGQAMQSAVPAGEGAMAAIIGLELDQLESVLNGIADCDIANDNSPGQIVISGKVDAVNQAMIAAQSIGAKRAILLPVSAPFHSRLMTKAADVMERAFESVTFAEPIIPVIPNVTAILCEDAENFKALLVEQICGRVRWRESIAALAESGVTTFVEIGAGKVLTGLNKRIAPDATSLTINTPVDLESYLKAI